MTRERHNCDAPGCSNPLSGRRRRFCCDDCARAGRRAERQTETSELARAILRMLRAMPTRFKDEDVTELPAVWEIVQVADQVAAQAITRLRATGYTWQEIADVLGMKYLQQIEQWHRRRSAFNDPLKIIAPSGPRAGGAR